MTPTENPHELDRKSLGQRGESIARQHVESLGWNIVATNWRHELGELDIIAQDKHTLIFIEVRTRRGINSINNALMSITPRKKEKIAELVDAYCHENDLSPTQLMRVDVIAVGLGADDLFKVEMVHDALSW